MDSSRSEDICPECEEPEGTVMVKCKLTQGEIIGNKYSLGCLERVKGDQPPLRNGDSNNLSRSLPLC